MIFSAPQFLFAFLPLTLTAWLVLNRSKSVLLVASLAFYFLGAASAGEPQHIWILLGSIAGNFVVGNWINRSKGPHRRIALCCGVAGNVLVLAWFKYAAFIASIVGLPSFKVSPVLGISFFVFQAIAYLADIYRGTIAPSNSLFQFALFKSFFPQLIAGPIVRYQQVSSDLASDRASEEMFAQGVSRFIVGLGKKVIIADNLAVLVDSVWATSNVTAEYAWLGTLAFGLQIYFDFSGYSDMAIGMASMFGIRLPENFNYPYISASIQEFWRRWHISLSTWFRDYLYIPLGGSRGGKLRTFANLFIVFALCGLWHGASWAFVAWGLWHGIFLALERTPFGQLLSRAPAALRHLYVIVVVLIGWTIFRSGTIAEAAAMLRAMVGGNGWFSAEMPLAIRFDPFIALILVTGVICSAPFSGVATRMRSLLAYEAALAATLLVSLACVASQTHLAFIYFRF